MEAGQSLLNYRLVERIGAGGMGVVWKAVDTTLDREAAIKVLPDALARETERLARFEREAKLLASLNHPSIASIYGLHEAEGVRFLVMELVPGEDLAARLERGGLSFEEASRIGLQVAEALETAHENGVIHRDLKPANIRITPDGKAKVLDFGLAKAFDPTTSGPSPDSSLSPTMTAAHTVQGVILGTAGYMSPEQAAGQPTDKRCDIWSFGVVLYEMLVGGKLFDGETVSHTLADVLRGSIEWKMLPEKTPRALREILRRCLERDPKRRMRDIGEARVILEDHLAGRSDDQEEAAKPHVTTAPARSRLAWVLASAATLIAAVSVTMLLVSVKSSSPPVGRFTLQSPNVAGLRQGDGLAIAISPDGRKIVNVGASGSEDLLYMRAIDEFEVHPLEGTNGARMPFFSPDGRWLAFTSTRALHKMSMSGGPPISIAPFPSSAPYGATWSSDGFIYYASANEIFQVDPSGGEPKPIQSGGVPLYQPVALPSGLLLVKSSNSLSQPGPIMILDPHDGSLKDLGIRGTDPRYLPTGHLMYANSEQVMVARLDLGRHEVAGTAVPVLDRVLNDGGIMQLAVSDNGTMVYLPRRPGEQQTPVVVNREGTAKPLVDSKMPFTEVNDLRLSPDGRRLALSVANGPIWILDLESGAPTLISDSGFYPIWSPDASSLIYASTRAKSFDLYRRGIDLSRPETIVLDREHNLRSAAWAPDGTFIFREEIPGKGMDLRAWPGGAGDESAIQPLLEGAEDELAPAVSPDGRWLAYLSNQSGRDEIYVTSFPTPGGRVQISVAGGSSPAWSPDGKELFYLEGDAMIAVQLELEPSPRIMRRDRLFEGNYTQYRWHRQYDVHPDGDRFIMIQNPPASDVEVVVNWFTELDRLTAAAE